MKQIVLHFSGDEDANWTNHDRHLLTNKFGTKYIFL